MAMKAAVFYEPGKIVVEEHPYRKPGKGEVLIQVKAAGAVQGARWESLCFRSPLRHECRVQH